MLHRSPSRHVLHPFLRQNLSILHPSSCTLPFFPLGSTPGGPLGVPGGARAFFVFSAGGAQDWLRRMAANGAPHTNILIALNVSAFLLQQLVPRFTAQFALLNALVAVKGEWWRILTSSFLHTGIIHLAVNMYTLYVLAPQLEQACGSKRFTLIYLISCTSGGLMQYSMTPMYSASMGSSTALAGLFGGYVVYKWRNKAFVRFDQSDMSWIAQVVGINLLLGVMGGSSIGHWAHLGGLLGGSAAMLLLGPRYVWGRGRQVDAPIIPLPSWLK